MKKLILLFVVYLFTVQANAQYDVVVAKDGTGNYTTVQAAINAAPSNRSTPYRIFIKKGKYVEKVTISATKTFLYFIGEGINEVNISWDDYAGKAGVSEIATVTIFGDDCAFMNMTIENSWGRHYDGPQALAIRANADRLIFTNCKMVSGQDTVMANGNGKKQYFRNCYIDGNTDYIYGSAIAVFDSCVIFNRDRLDGSTGSVFTAASTPAGQTYGYVFRNCLLPNNNGQTTYTLGRPWGNAAPPHTSETKVVFLNCKMGNTVSPRRWQVWTPETDTTIITYAEYKTRYFNGTPVDLSNRVPWSQDFTDAQAAPYFVNSNIFGTWNPCAVLADACVPFNPVITISNFRVNRSSAASTIRYNICWPISGVTYELHRSADSINFSLLNSYTSTTDTSIAYQFTDVLPPTGINYFYKIIANKAGFATYTTDTVLKVNITIPLNGEYRSANSGPWSNNVSAASTLSGGQVTAVSITASPSGYTASPTVTFTAAPAGGTTASGTAILTNGVVTGVYITNPGSGYIAAPTVTFSTTAVGGNSVWQVYNSSTTSWNAVALGTSPSNTNVTIRTGNTITLNTLAGIGSLTIESGATFNATSNALQGATQTIRVGNGTAPVTAFIKNDGMFGSTSGTNDGIIVEPATGCKNLIISGTGVTSIARFRPLPPNPNSLVVVIDQNMDFNMSNNTGLTGYYNNTSNNNTEVVTITINADKIVRMTQPGGGFHTSASTTNQMGTVIYNINGTLDVSATNSIAMVPNSVNPASSVTMNIGSQGVFKTGGVFTMTNTGGSTYGTARVVVDSGGIFDATRTTTFTAGNTTNSGYVVLNGGVLRRAAANTNVVFPVAPTTTSYNPVTINNAGTPDKFVVNVKTTFDQPVPDAAKAVNRQWFISEDTVGGSNATVRLAWTTAEQGAGFDPAAAVSIIRYTGTGWQGYPATVTGTGTAANPYVATAAGITAFSPFSIINTGALPAKLVSFTAAYKNSSVQSFWITTNEEGTQRFEVERSTDTRSFRYVGTVAAANTAGTHNYSFDDAAPLKGISYYRLKMIDKDGSFIYSKMAIVNSPTAGSLSVSPNPAINTIIVTYPGVVSSGKLQLVAADGKLLQTLILPGGTSQTSMDVKALANGIYYIKLGDGQNIVPFIKQ